MSESEQMRLAIAEANGMTDIHRNNRGELVWTPRGPIFVLQPLQVPDWPNDPEALGLLEARLIEKGQMTDDVSGDAMTRCRRVIGVLKREAVGA